MIPSRRRLGSHTLVDRLRDRRSWSAVAVTVVALFIGLRALAYREESRQLRGELAALRVASIEEASIDSVPAEPQRGVDLTPPVRESRRYPANGAATVTRAAAVAEEPRRRTLARRVVLPPNRPRRDRSLSRSTATNDTEIGSADEPSIIAVTATPAPVARSWVVSNDEVRWSLEFSNGTRVWLGEGETFGSFTLVHADRAHAIGVDPRRALGVRCRVPGRSGSTAWSGFDEGQP